MNHLFLWVGSRSDTEQAGHTLLMPYKSDGARPAFGAMEKLPAILPIENLAKLIREHIDGVSSVLPFDNESNEPAVACDLLGTFHLHLRRLSDGIAVRNSGAILAGLKPSSNLDALGVQESCSNAAANEDPTIWQEVRKLRSGRILKLNTSSSHPELIAHRPLLAVLNDVSEYGADPLTRVINAISDTLILLNRNSDDDGILRTLPWAADLTGGNDSRALLAAIMANRIDVAATVSGSVDDPGVVISKQLVRELAIPHFHRPLPGPITHTEFMNSLCLTDAEFDAVEFASVAAVRRQHIADSLKLSLNGSYGEIGRGHAWRLGLSGMLLPSLMAKGLRRRTPHTLQDASVVRWGQTFAFRFPSDLFFAGTASQAEGYFPAIIERLESCAGHLPKHAQLDLIHRALWMERWQGRSASTKQLSRAISPREFQKPIISLLTATPTVRRDGLLTRKLTEACSPLLAREPLYAESPPAPLTMRTVHRFLPLVYWFGRRAIDKIASRLNFGEARDPLPTVSHLESLLRCSDRLRGWLSAPLPATTGLFNRDSLARRSSLATPLSAVDYRLWCRLMTLEASFRLQAQAPSAPRPGDNVCQT